MKGYKLNEKATKVVVESVLTLAAKADAGSGDLMQCARNCASLSCDRPSIGDTVSVPSRCSRQMNVFRADLGSVQECLEKIVSDSLSARSAYEDDRKCSPANYPPEIG
jgi:hypothetical protein